MIHHHAAWHHLHRLPAPFYVLNGRLASLRTAHPLTAITMMTQAIKNATRPIVTV